MYIRMYDDLKKKSDDNPTIGIVLCSKTDEDIARYSVLHDSKQIFMAKYMPYMPTKEELKLEIEKEKAELENELANLKNELFKLRFQSATNQLDNPLQIKSVRKDIARIKTILRERELKEQNA
mgnify:CR=1 FL=1